jgi:putative spermidine/putrescine transport system substrate-binding protein
MRKVLVLWILILVAISPEACKSQKHSDIAAMNWDQILAAAKGTEVTLMMWGGDPYINTYMNRYVKPHLKNDYGVTLNISEGQGNKIVQILMTEIEAKESQSQIDLCWINGETFYQLRQIKALYGPFTARLPNARYIDWTNLFINTDFQQPVNGMECPWGNVQFAIIYDSNRVKTPPKNMAELEAYVKQHPGKFTIGTDFTGMTLLKSFLIAISGNQSELSGPFNKVKYEKYSAELWDYINRIKPYFWKEGKTFPDAVAPMHQMFVSGELDFTMSNNDGEVDNKVLQKFFPPTSRAYVLDSGTIQNSHYMGIVNRSGNQAAAMVVCNFLISPEAQLEKLKPSVWGDGIVLSTDLLPPEWKSKFQNVPGRKYAPKRNEINSKALPELAPEYMIRLYDDFRKNVIEK